MTAALIAVNVTAIVLNLIALALIVAKNANVPGPRRKGNPL